MQKIFLGVILLLAATSTVNAVDYPGRSPGAAKGFVTPEQLILSNDVLQCRWTVREGKIVSFTATDLQTGEVAELSSGSIPQIVLVDSKPMDLATISPEHGFEQTELEPDGASAKTERRLPGRQIRATFRDEESGIQVDWAAELREASNYVTQAICVTTTRDVAIEELVFVDAELAGAKQVGQVDGSVVVRDGFFLAVEHPLARNTVHKGSRVRCALPRGNVLKRGQSWCYTSVVGVVPADQLRRGFLYYLERRRAHAYRPFLHYNSWYHLNIGRPDNHMTEAECLATITMFGRELIEKRGGQLDAFVWDDGWDDFNSLWGFHQDFPDGFRNLMKEGKKYGAAQGVWMSPWGGYGGPKKKRLEYGESQGFETNQKGFSMAGPKYRAAFRDVCLNMMHAHGVVFFKFDGMGAGGGTGAPGALADDVDAVLNLTRELRQEDPRLFISATVGTWASPFWTLYADSIWRQGGDTGFHGPGNGRQQWLTYRDMFCYRCIVQWGPLYPLNSLMLHGPCIGERTNPAKMPRDEQSVADEFWTFFGSGTNLQELYISPQLLTAKMWDELAAATRWSRANCDLLVDTHWIGGDPGAGVPYGWASWQPRGGLLTLRNPSSETKRFSLELASAFSLPDAFLTDYQLTAVRPGQRIGQLRMSPIESIEIELDPFEVLVFEATQVAGSQ